MRAFSLCITCVKEASEKLATTGESTPAKFLYAEMENNGIVYLTCERGHKTAVLHQGCKHQFLFESGCHALLDHYTNEAVSTFSAALERAYEFFLRVACRKLELPPSLLDELWKYVKKQSERQFGAFVFLFPVITGESFRLPQRIPEFRNKIIHQGDIARFDEVKEYAEAIFVLIRKIMDVLNKTCSTEMWAEINHAAEVQRSAVPVGMEWTGVSGPQFDLTVDLTFESWMDELRSKHEG